MKSLDYKVPEYKKIINEGGYKYFKNFIGSNECQQFIEEKTLEGISIISNKRTSQNVRNSGLEKMHHFFSVDYLPFLQQFLKNETSEYFRKICTNFSFQHLGLKKDFYIDNSVALRFHYPYEICKRSKLKQNAYHKLNLKNFRQASQELKKTLSGFSENSLNEKDRLTSIYHRNLPVLARIHGPHKDTWFGHTFDAINLWYCVAGVNKLSSMVMYPETFGIDFPHLKHPNYIAPGTILPKPYKVELPNKTMLAFNADILHGTHINIIDSTRIVFTGRINPNKPKFYDETSQAEYPNWHLSSDIQKGINNNILKFPRKKNFGKQKVLPLKIHIQDKIQVTVGKKLNQSFDIPLFEASLLDSGKKIIAKFQNKTLLFFKIKKGFKAISSKCPHLGISMEDGFHEGENIYCPGHALKFDLSTGKSDCKSLKVKVYECYTKNKHIFIAAN